MEAFQIGDIVELRGIKANYPGVRLIVRITNKFPISHSFTHTRKKPRKLAPGHFRTKLLYADWANYPINQKRQNDLIKLGGFVLHEEEDEAGVFGMTFKKKLVLLHIYSKIGMSRSVPIDGYRVFEGEEKAKWMMLAGIE